jgi:hypothetical protein
VTVRRIVVFVAGLMAVGVLVGPVGARENALPAGNLVKNPGGEAPVGGALPSTAPVYPAAWEKQEGLTDPSGQPSTPVQLLRYGTHQQVLAPAVSAAIGGGRSFFHGGYPNGISKTFQVIDVSAAATEIDAGGVKACVSAYLGGGLEGTAGTNGTARADLQFLGEDDAARGQLGLGPVTRGHRSGAATLLRRASEKGVPAGTRKLVVSLTFTGAYPSNTGMADNVSVALVKGGSCDPVLLVKCVKKALVATVTSSAVAPTQRVRFAVKGGKKTKQATAKSTSRFTMDGLTGKLTVTATVAQKGGGTITVTKKSRRC